jgi:AcrR family transcriptional regulator
MDHPLARSASASGRRTDPRTATEPGTEISLPAPAPGLRERKRKQLHERLVAVALRLFTERGFDYVTIADIVTEVDVSPRTFFRYFPSKEAVVVAWHEKQNAELLHDVLTQSPSTPPLVAARRAVARIVEAHETDRDRALGFARLTQASPSVQTELAGSNQRLQRELADGIAARWALPPQSLVAPTTAAVVLAGENVGVEAWLNRGGIGSPNALVDEAFDTLAATLSTAADAVGLRRRSAKR